MTTPRERRAAMRAERDAAGRLAEGYKNRLRALAQRLRDACDGPNDGPQIAEDYARRVIERAERAEALLAKAEQALQDAPEYSTGTVENLDFEVNGTSCTDESPHGSCLQYSEGYNAGARDGFRHGELTERARVVAYLRGNGPPTCCQGCAGGYNTLINRADGIERGKHVSKKPTKVNTSPERVREANVSAKADKATK